MLGRPNWLRPWVLLVAATAALVAATVSGDNSAAVGVTASADVFSGATLRNVYGAPNDSELYTDTELADAADIASVMQRCVYCTRDNCPVDEHKAPLSVHSEYFEGDGHGFHNECMPNSYVVDCGAKATEHPLAEPTGCPSISLGDLAEIESQIRSAQADGAGSALRDLLREDGRILLNEHRKALAGGNM